MSCLVFFYIVLSCLVLSCLVMSCHVMSCHVLSCFIFAKERTSRVIFKPQMNHFIFSVSVVYFKYFLIIFLSNLKVMFLKM